MKAGTQRGIIIVLLFGIIGILLFPEVIRKAVLEVTATETGREKDSESDSRPNPQKETIPFARASSY